ncbi:nectin-3-like protein [Trichomycterus rosablanca]|uniref:nectin-3-like protein n=1 Tax=Trichomycterus rosablanca TaxID=2290929 RepID=UPI002F351EAD
MENYLRNNLLQPGVHLPLLILLTTALGVCGGQVVVPPKVSGVLGKNVTLGCSFQMDSNLSLTQISWEKRSGSSWSTIAVFNPVFGKVITPEYRERLSFHSSSAHDATVVLRDVGFADAAVYTCKVATFPLGNAQASTTLSVLVEPKVYVSAGSTPLLDGGNLTTVATCIAERARPPAEVSWQTDLYGKPETHMQEEANGTTTTQVHYTWQPVRHAQGHILTCVVKHPALQSEFRIPYTINVQFAPDIQLLGYDGDWYVGRENVQLKCQARSNPPAHHFRWIRLDGEMPSGVQALNNTLTFLRPLQRNDSGVYRCEVGNDMGVRTRDLQIRIQDPPSTTMPPTTPVLLLNAGISVTAAGNKHRALFTSPTLAPLHDSHLGTIVGGAVGGVLFLLLLLVLVGIFYQRRKRTFRGDYYTKQYVGPSDMQKAPPPPHELQQVYANEADRDSLETKPKTPHELNGSIFADKDREEWGGFERERSQNGRSRALREANALNNQHHHPSYYANHHANHHPDNQPNQPHHPQNSSGTQNKQRSSLKPETRRYPGPQVMGNGSPCLPEDCYDSDYVSHTDGSMISRREWYV